MISNVFVLVYALNGVRMILTTFLLFYNICIKNPRLFMFMDLAVRPGRGTTTQLEDSGLIETKFNRQKSHNNEWDIFHAHKLNQL